MNGKQNNFFILTPAAFFREAGKSPVTDFRWQGLKINCFSSMGGPPLCSLGLFRRARPLNFHSAKRKSYYPVRIPASGSSGDKPFAL